MRVCSMHILHNSSIYVKKAALTAFIALFSAHHSILSEKEKKEFKNVLFVCIGIGNVNDGFHGLLTPDVFLLSQYGILMYFSVKSSDELTGLAAGYDKNCKLLFERIRKIRKSTFAQGDSNIPAPIVVDSVLVSTIVSACCMVLLCPIDVSNCYFFESFNI